MQFEPIATALISIAAFELTAKLLAQQSHKHVIVGVTTACFFFSLFFLGVKHFETKQ
jgi:hypothetical protein